ncbi:MAG: CAP domain-containing protein [Bacteroidetes bacterium]|nr:CAP domain-containing protein [Bacteroidota bacterium]
MRVTKFIGLTLLLCCLQISQLLAQDKASLQLEKEVWQAINDYRKEQGKEALQWSDTLAIVARKHCNYMIKDNNGQLSHDGFEKRFDVIKKSIPAADGMGENVASGIVSGKAALELWLKSAGHKRNIEGNYNMTGVGVATSKDGRIFFTQIFLHKH